MSDMNTDQSSGAGIDLSQFYQVFFEEAGENPRQHGAAVAGHRHRGGALADDEELNSIFRCAHSVKGGAATFGFADVAELTHQTETLLTGCAATSWNRQLRWPRRAASVG